MRRGEVWLVDLGMAQKTRPALVLSTGYADDDRALVTIVSHTTSLRGSEFEIAVPVPFPEAGCLHGSERHDGSRPAGLCTGLDV